MRVVFISWASPPIYSGAGRAAFNQARCLRDTGIESCILTAKFNSHMPCFEIMQRIPIWRFPVRSASRWDTSFFYLQCALWLVKHRRMYDIIHFAFMPSHWYPVFLFAKLMKKPIFVTMTLYGSDDLETTRKSRLGFVKLFLFLHVNRILAISKSLVEVSRKYATNNDLISYLTYPVDTSVFRPPKSPEEKLDLRKEFGVSEGDYIVLFSGSVIRRKGFDLLIEAWSKVVETVSRTKLYVVGPRIFDNEYGYTNQEFSRCIDMRIQALGLKSSVIFLGERAELVPELLRMADMFVFPSREEGLGVALIEAMATSLPCLICDQPWVPKDLIRHMETGLVCEPTPESIAEGILTVYANHNLAQRIGVAAHKVVELDYNPVILTKRLIELYASSLR